MKKRLKTYAKFGILLSLTVFFLLYYYVAIKGNTYQINMGFKRTQRNAHKRKFEVLSKIGHHKKLLRIEGNVYRYGDCNEEIKIAVVCCGDRLNQTVTSLKSIIAVSKQNVHFIIVADHDNNEGIKDKILKWPSVALHRLSFEIYPISFPSGKEGEEWKQLFKLCACQRLFLPSLLQNVDSLLYIDVDVLFMQPVENLWRYFHKFNNTQIAAVCPEHEEFATGWYNRFAKHPYYKPLGVNSGVMLMNLTRMRAFHWEEYLSPIMKEYKLNIVWGDQDIINIIFFYHPDKLYIFPCEWNYRPDHCMYSSMCKTAEKNGVAAIHGSRGVFFNNKQPVFKTIYDAIFKMDFNFDLNISFVEYLKLNLKDPPSTNCGRTLYKLFSQRKTLVLD